jgi:hypothetical protein
VRGRFHWECQLHGKWRKIRYESVTPL